MLRGVAGGDGLYRKDFKLYILLLLCHLLVCAFISIRDGGIKCVCFSLDLYLWWLLCFRFFAVRVWPCCVFFSSFLFFQITTSKCVSKCVKILRYFCTEVISLIQTQLCVHNSTFTTQIYSQ